MNDLQLEYLRALEIPVWAHRDAQAPSGTRSLIRLGPGKHAQLFICADPEASASQLAADVQRAMPASAVWAWPDMEGGGLGVTEAVDERLFTAVVIFGKDLAMELLGEPLPASLNSAVLVVAPGLDDLAGSGKLRREFWQALQGHRLAG